MDERDVKAFQVVVAIQEPVCRDLIDARPGGIGDEAIDAKQRRALAHRRNQRLERNGRVECGETERSDPIELDPRQVVRSRREIAHALELGHRKEAAVESEAAAVIAAT